MRIRCPHCSQPIEMVPDLESAEITCPSCGSHFSLLGDGTETATIAFGPRPQIRHFVLEESIGIGQFGRVWRAYDERLQRFVAVKVPHEQSLSPVERRYFRREAQTAAVLNHPNIVRIYEVGETDETIYIVSQYIAGISLREWMRRFRRPHYGTIVELTTTIARAIDHAHSRGVIHRDLKPGNVILDDNNQPYVTDFGLAKNAGVLATIAVTGQVIGTPAYMSPEQIRDAHRVDERSDVYALGIILYELLTGERPFSGRRGILFDQVLHDEPRRPRAIRKDIPTDLESICLMALRKDPDDRYQTAAEMADDLERFQRGESVRAARYSYTQAAYRWLRHRPSVAASIILACVVVLLGWRLMPQRVAPAPPPLTGTQVRLATEPPGAKLAIVPLDAETGELHIDRMQHAANTPLNMVLPAGDYLVVAYTPDQTRFHEVYRRVPPQDARLSGLYLHQQWKRRADGVVELPTIRLFAQQDIVKKMSRAKGGRFQSTAFDRRGPAGVLLPSWYVDATETTYAMAMAAAEDAGRRNPWTSAATKPNPQMPFTNLRWDAAVHWAELMGKRLMTAHEYEYLLRLRLAGRNRGAPAPNDQPTGEVDDPHWDRVDDPRMDGPLVGLHSNAMEWTTTWWTDAGVGRAYFMVVGTDKVKGEPQVLQTPSRDASQAMQAVRLFATDPRLGFRCARSARPRIRPRDFARIQYTSHQQASIPLPRRLPSSAATRQPIAAR